MHLHVHDCMYMSTLYMIFTSSRCVCPLFTFVQCGLQGYYAGCREGSGYYLTDYSPTLFVVCCFLSLKAKIFYHL